MYRGTGCLIPERFTGLKCDLGRGLLVGTRLGCEGVTFDTEVGVFIQIDIRDFYVFQSVNTSAASAVFNFVLTGARWQSYSASSSLRARHAAFR